VVEYDLTLAQTHLGGDDVADPVALYLRED
jgi:hypothetical protein